VSPDAERAIEDAIAICEIAAPTGHEERRARHVAAALEALGLETTIDESGSVVASAGPQSEPPIVVAAHLDTVFPGVEEITVRRDGHVLHGPGVGDNSLGVAGLLHLARHLAAHPPATRPVLLAATTGEEGFGNLRGARHVVATRRPHEFVALEGGGVGELVTAGVGSARFALRATAAGGHSWRDRDQPSAVHTLVAFLQRPLAEPGTASRNVGSISGGSGINVLATHAEATFEFRDVDTARLDAAAARLAEEAREAGIELEVLGRRPGGATPADHPLVADAIAAARAAGLDAPHLAEASTDANAALAEGIPAVTVGLCTSHDAHTLDESVDVSALAASLAALTDLVGRRSAA
jgi:tripeptide aminopeptidase